MIVKTWAVGTVLVVLALSVVGNGYLIWKMREEWRVVEVIDGDTVRLPNRQKIRLAGVDAPELNDCRGNGAKERLTQLVKGKVINFESKGWDMYERRIGRVTVGNKDVAEIMLAEGLGEYEWVKDSDVSRLKAARDKAYAASFGIWSRECGYVKPGESTPSGCKIIGNINHGTRTYMMPGCPNYGQLKIEPIKGDRYFCSEDEATKAGFVKVENCRR